MITIGVHKSAPMADGAGHAEYVKGAGADGEEMLRIFMPGVQGGMLLTHLTDEDVKALRKLMTP